MQQIFSIIALMDGYLIVLATVLVILPTIVVILLRYALYRHLKSSTVKVKKLLNGFNLKSYPKIVNKLEQRFVDGKVNLAKVNTSSVIKGTFSQEKFYFLGIPLSCEFIEYLTCVVPNLLLSLGLLGTFLGITFNLTNLSQTITQIDVNDVKNLLEQLNTPLKGIEVAFLTSLMAIACGFLLTVLNLFWNTNLVKTSLLIYLEDYIDNIYLPKIQPISYLEVAVNKFSSDFEGMLHQLGNKIEESMTRAFSRIETSTNTFEKAAKILDHSGFPERLAAATNDLAIAQNRFSQSSLVLQKATQSFDYNLVAMQKITKQFRTYALTERESCVVKEQGNEEDVQ
jgi:hypothetical protein